MSLAILAGAVLLLLLLIARLKFNAFLALLLVSFLAGMANGLGAEAALRSVLKGIGDTMGGLALLLVFGAILGKRIEESGAAHAISDALTRALGKRRLALSILITGFLVGMPMIYNASFLVLIPLVYSLSATSGIPLLQLGIPLSSALSVTHGYLPPHPAPASIAVLYHADVGRTLLYGLLLAVPATVLAGPILARFFRDRKNMPPPELYQPRDLSTLRMPGFATSLLAVLSPVLLMLAGAVADGLQLAGPAARLLKFIGDPTVALFLAVALSFYTLGLRRGEKLESLMKSVGAGAASVSMVLLIIAAGGAFKQVLLDSGTGEAIKRVALTLPVSPLLLAWSTAALLRLALGSATVAAITAAGIVLPIVPGSHAAPELLVLATTSGSLMFSHFNDIGFWMFKEYYNASIRDTFQIWTVMESLVAVVGLCGTLLLGQVVHAAPQRVAYVNSYHAGYAPSDEVMAALKETLSAQGVAVDTYFLDGKRDPSGVAGRAADVVSAIRRTRPALLIASDDDAAKYVVAPHFRDGPMPVVFCGVNWSADQYGLPTANVTGMLEVVPIEDALREIRRQFPAAKGLAVVSEDSVSERSNTKLLDARYRALGFAPEYALVSDFVAWKQAFARAQQTADVVYLPTNGAVSGWNRTEAAAWVAKTIRKPAVTCDDFMMPYAVFGLTKIPREQGEWAAKTALAILRGAKPADFPVASNRRSACYINDALAARVGFRSPAGRDCESVK